MSTNRASRGGAKVLHAPDDQALLDRFAAAPGEAHAEGPKRIMIDPDKVGRDLARLVLGVVELLSDLMERQAVRRVENGVLSDEEIERLGQTFLALQVRMQELKAAFGLENEDLTLNLGPLRDLVSDDQ
jgi:hypothetical protein